jgi:hypothetical protein
MSLPPAAFDLDGFTCIAVCAAILAVIWTSAAEYATPSAAHPNAQQCDFLAIERWARAAECATPSAANPDARQGSLPAFECTAATERDREQAIAHARSRLQSPFMRDHLRMQAEYFPDLKALMDGVDARALADAGKRVSENAADRPKTANQRLVAQHSGAAPESRIE